MAFETVAIPLDENWTLVSNAATGPLEASFDNGEAFFFFGAVAPINGGVFGLSRSDLSMPALATKVWARGTAGAIGILTVYRTVDAGNPAVLTLSPLTLSAINAREGSAPGTVVATIGGKTPSSIIEIKPNDGRFVVSNDGTKLLRGNSSVSAGNVDIRLTESMRRAGNSPRTTPLTIAVAEPAPLTITGTPPDWIEGERYSWKPDISGGVGPYTVTVTGLEGSGLHYNRRTGEIYSD